MKREIQKKEKPEFDQKMVDLARVTRVTKGGKQLSFRALVVIGDKKGKIGYGVAKGKDVTLAVSKAVDQAKKVLIKIPLQQGTIPHKIVTKFKAAIVMLKPAPAGTGVKAGGPVRVVLDLAGVENIVGKMMGSKNKINNIKCVYLALKKLKPGRLLTDSKQNNS
ncbi:MAG TPA: 30S ribosomal protein S5 [bacterium]|nr:30S ribosomal protein S5 [bacterium]HPL95664.1 30S ribosomal protein S5 [bacterium]